MGTVIHARQLARIQNMLSTATSTTSARVTAGGYKLTGASPLLDQDGATFDLTEGAFFAPTIVEGVEVTDQLWVEEVFGPVLVVKRFKVVILLWIDGRWILMVGISRMKLRLCNLPTRANTGSVQVYGKGISLAGIV